MFNDIDDSIAIGGTSITMSEDLKQERFVYSKLFKRNLMLYCGVVKKVNIDDMTVDIQKGEVYTRGYYNEEYRNCKIMNLGTVDSNNNYHGYAQLPKEGDRVIYGFLLGIEEQPIILGTLLTGNKVDAINELKGKNINTDAYYRNGKAKITVKESGDVLVENDNAIVKIENDGKVTINNGTKGVARVDDTTIANATTDPVAFAALAGIGVTSITGKISSGSTNVKIG